MQVAVRLVLAAMLVVATLALLVMVVATAPLLRAFLMGVVTVRGAQVPALLPGEVLTAQ
jgi:hypothetical protein